MSHDEQPERCMLICRECHADPARLARCGDRLVVPFRTRADRASWAREHNLATGHDAWYTLDNWVSAEEARQRMAGHDAFIAGLAAAS